MQSEAWVLSVPPSASLSRTLRSLKALLRKLNLSFLCCSPVATWMQWFKVNATLGMQELCILGFCLSHLDVEDVHTVRIIRLIRQFLTPSILLWLLAYLSRGQFPRFYANTLKFYRIKISLLILWIECGTLYINSNTDADFFLKTVRKFLSLKVSIFSMWIIFLTKNCFLYGEQFSET